MRSAKFKLVMTLLLVLMILVLPVHAQEVNVDTGNLVIQSDSIPLDVEAITEAADPLLDRGATVAIYLADEGGLETWDRWLREHGLLQGSTYLDEFIGIYVSLGTRNLSIDYGINWEAQLAPRAEGIWSSELGPNLREESYDLAFISTLQAIDAALADTPIAPTPTTTALGGDDGGLAGSEIDPEVTPTKRPSGGFVPPADEPVARPTFQPYSPPTNNFPTGDGGDSGFSGLLFCCLLPLGLFTRFLFPFGGGYSTSRPRYRSSWNSPNVGSRGSFGGGRSSGGSRGSGSFRGGGRSSGKF